MLKKIVNMIFDLVKIELILVLMFYRLINSAYDFV